MKRNIIKIEGNTVIVSTAPAGNYMGNDLGNGIWMTVWEIAEAFNVTGTTVNKAIKAIRKLDILNEYEVCKSIRLDSGNTADVYSLEIIIPVAYRIDTFFTDVFRKWVVDKVCEKGRKGERIFLHLPLNGFHC